MELHIGSEIRRVLDEKGISAEWLATQINTSRRNIYDILQRQEISTGQLTEISKALNHNFYKLYLSNVNEPEVEYEVKRREVVKITVELDGLQTTYDFWIKKLKAINDVI